MCDIAQHTHVPLLKHLPETPYGRGRAWEIGTATYSCPCSYHSDAEKSCTCSPSVVARYQKRISGPLLDRIDIHVDVPRVNYEKLSGTRQGEPSAAVRERVASARAVQSRRFKGTRLRTNADMGPAEASS